MRKICFVSDSLLAQPSLSHGEATTPSLHDYPQRYGIHFHSPFNMLDAVHWRRCKSSDDATKQFVIVEKMELANHNSLLDHGQTESPIFITRSTVFPW